MFLGRDASGRQAAPVHMTKVKPPKVRYNGSTAGSRPDKGTRPRASATTGTEDPTQQELSTSMPAQTHIPAAPPYVNPGTAVSEQTGAASAAAAARPVTDEWRRWIAENLMLGASRDSIFKTMIDDGLSPSESAAEIDLAARSPYLKGAERLCSRLKKREWLLAAYRKLNRLHSKAGEIERRHKLAHREFLDSYYCSSRPVIVTGMMDDWPALAKWSLDYFAHNFGDREVDVQVGRNAGGNYEADREKYRSKMIFSDFIDKVRTSGVSNDIYITASNNSANKETLPELWDDIVQIPEYLNGGVLHNGFLWIGPAGTITPFHHDLTNNFMAQVMGRKRILLTPSWDMPLMRNLFHVYSEIDGRATPPDPRPRFGQPQVLECILNPGEILFLPVGCLHFVEALEISATVSFTNFAFDDNDYTSFYHTYHNV